MSLNKEVKLVSKDLLFIVRLAIGFLLIVVGLIGLIFPIMPDWILILVGLLFFDVNGRISTFLIKFLPNRYRSKARSITLKIEKKIDKILGKWR
jgi:uncharacterized membrane protein YbaN (DUF454 family)